jgi:flagellin
MAITLGSNIASLRGQRQLSRTSEELGTVFQRLSSGQRINKASDDAAGLAVSEAVYAKVVRSRQGGRNIRDGLSAMEIVDSALNSLQDIVTRRVELSQQAANGTLSLKQREALNVEFGELGVEYQRIIATTNFNNMPLLDSSFTRLQIATGSGPLVVPITELGSASQTTLLPSGTYNDTNFNLSGDTAYGPILHCVGDLNGDGIDDVATVNTFRDGGPASIPIEIPVTVYFGSASGLLPGFTFNYVSPSLTGGISQLDIRIEPGDNDIQVELTAGGSEAFEVVLNPDGTIASSGSIAGFANQGAATVTGDFNHDGLTDIVENTSATSYRFRMQIPIVQQTSGPVIADLSLPSGTIVTQNLAKTALDANRTASERISAVRGVVGASMARLEVAERIAEANAEVQESVRTRIRSADIAYESANLARLSILQQSASAVLAQANQQPALALQLLQGGK